MFARATIPIGNLLVGYEAALAEVGYSFSTRLDYLKYANLIIHRHQNKGLEYLEPEIFLNYIQEVDEKFLAGNLKKHSHWRVRQAIEKFVAYICSGKVGMLPSPLRGARQRLGPAFQQIADAFLSGDFHANTRCDMRWVTHKYFAWLETQGFSHLEGVGAVHIQKFLLACSEMCSPGSVHNIRIYLKKLYAYLYKAGLSDTDHKELLSFTVNREQRVHPALPKADIAKLLDVIDRNSVKGKRDYAVMMLGTVLGLRACDIVALNLADIDWLHGEIKLIQSKTTNPVALPLTQDVGDALMDYILNARPNTSSQRVFLRICAPYLPLTSAVTIGEIYEDCCIAAGLPVNKRFHDLRRSLGTSMVSNGVSVYDVAQVFGDRNIESTKPYLSADLEHLKMCALPFEGIAPLGGDRA